MIKNKDKKTHGNIGAILKIAAGAILLLLAGLSIAASVLFHFDEWHEFDPKLITDCPEALRIYDIKGELISVMGNEKRIPISISELNKHTIDAFVAAEDARFYTHSGIDLYRIFGAAWADIKAGSYVQGASTISQQLIKLSHLSSEKTLDRKLEEAVLATQLESVFSKDEIMEMYLNYIYFGGGYYGIETAALGYFGVHARGLSAAQSAQLAGILKSPVNYAPHLNPEASLGRRNNILNLMLEYGFLDETEYEEALSEEPALADGLPHERNCLIDLALEEAEGVLDVTREELLGGGYSLYLTMDSEISKACLELMKDDTLFPSDNAQAALVVLDGNSGIAAMAGGRGEYAPGGLNRAEDTERQPGSLIKPVLVYAPALEVGGCCAATIIEDEPTSFGDYTPRNSDDAYYGAVTLRTAVTKSLNIPAVKVFEETGIMKCVEFAETAGISFEGESIGLPLALGGFTHGVSPLEIAGAYSAFQRGGLYTQPRSIDAITDRNGEFVYRRAMTSRRIMSEENAFILTSMLQSAASEGTARRLSASKLPLAAKTGTSIDLNGVRDAWCAAYSRDYTAVIWMGTDSAENGSLPENAVGGNNTAMILGKLFYKIYKDRNCEDFTVPKGVECLSIDLSDAENMNVYLAGEYSPESSVTGEYFLSGTGPSTENPIWKRPEPPADVGWSLDEFGLPIISFTAESEKLVYVILRSEPEENETEVFRINGKEGYVSFRDENVLRGGVYSYRILAVHPLLTEDDGRPMTSESSRIMRIVIPFY